MPRVHHEMIFAVDQRARHPQNGRTKASDPFVANLLKHSWSWIGSPATRQAGHFYDVNHGFLECARKDNVVRKAPATEVYQQLQRGERRTLGRVDHRDGPLRVLRHMARVSAPYGAGVNAIWRRYQRHMARVPTPHGAGASAIWRECQRHMRTTRSGARRRRSQSSMGKNAKPRGAFAGWDAAGAGCSRRGPAPRRERRGSTGRRCRACGRSCCSTRSRRRERS